MAGIIGYQSETNATAGEEAEHGQERQYLRSRTGPRRREPCAVDPALVDRARRPYLPRTHLRDPRPAALYLGGDLRALPAARLGARQARPRGRRHGRDHGAQHTRVLRSLVRRSDVGRGAQLAQHPARCGGDRLHPQPRRGEGPADRYRVRARHRGRRRADRPRHHGDRHRRQRRPRRQAARSNGLRGAPGRGRPRVRLADAGGRMGTRSRSTTRAGRPATPRASSITTAARS